MTASDDTSTLSDPIHLDRPDIKLIDIQTSVALPSTNATYPEQSLHDIVVNSNYWDDIDGDTNPTVTGKIKVKWYDAQGSDITDIIKNSGNSYKLDACSAPYQLTIQATEGTLSTAYGLPRELNFIGGNHTYYIYPKVNEIAKFCYAKPNLHFENNVNNPRDHFQSVTNGPGWIAGKGFGIYDANHPEKNFPTTGSNDLFFDLKITGLSSNKLIEINGSHVNAISGRGVSLSLIDNGGYLRVKLNGPSSASNGGDFSPSTFRLYADSGKTNYFYTFTIQRWYIAVYGAKTYYESANECANFNGSYRIPGVLDLTNSNRMWNNINWGDGIPGALDLYQRRISYKKEDGNWMGGLFSEWGSMVSNYGSSEIYFPGSDWENFPGPRNKGAFYWTSTEKENGRMNFLVNSRDGIVGHTVKNDQNWRTVCVTP